MKSCICRFLVIIGLLFSQNVNAQLQVFKYRITSMMGRNMEGDKWGEWYQPANGDKMKDILVVVDLPNKRISFYTAKLQEYSLIDAGSPREIDNKTVFNMEGIDNQNRKCSFIMILDYNNRKIELFQLYPTAELYYTLKTESIN